MVHCGASGNWPESVRERDDLCLGPCCKDLSRVRTFQTAYGIGSRFQIQVHRIDPFNVRQHWFSTVKLLVRSSTEHLNNRNDK